MAQPEIRPIRRPATAEERDEFQKYHEQVEEDLLELRRQAREAEATMRAAAMREPTVTGQLRRAIAESGVDHRELAAQTGLSPKTLAEFLVGTTALDSAAIDKLAAFLRHELKPIG